MVAKGSKGGGGKVGGNDRNIASFKINKSYGYNGDYDEQFCVVYY